MHAAWAITAGTPLRIRQITTVCHLTVCHGNLLSNRRRSKLRLPNTNNAGRHCLQHVCLPANRQTLLQSGSTLEQQRCQAIAANLSAAGDAPPEEQLSSLQKAVQVGGAVLSAVVAAVGIYAWCTGRTSGIVDYAGNSGLVPAFSLVFASEIGDRTFFIAGLLASSLGKWVSFIGSMSALAVMTVISVGIGYAFKNVPDALHGTLPIGKYLSVATMLYFGIRTLLDGWKMPSSDATDSDELSSARDSLNRAKQRGIGTHAVWQSVIEVGTLVFLAEWGDRSMFATIALATARSPAGVAIGATLGHVVATAIAVVFGAVAARYLSEKTIALTGGSLFLLFAGATIFGVF